jgi:hypothetical protein
MKSPLSGRLPVLLLALLVSSAPAIAADTTPPNVPPAANPVKPRRGEVLKLEGNSITAMPYLPPMDNGRSEPRTYLIDEETRITVGKLTDERPTPSGGVKETFKAEPGSREDLRVGQLVRIEAEGNRARRIIILSGPAEPKKE